MVLPNNTLLQGGKYRIIRFISAGGFGCTYEAMHVMLGKRIAIKEFFVKDFCNRDETTSHITVATQGKKALIDKLKKKFIEEAVALSCYNHPGIVRVADVFEENGTAYYVMDFIDGKSIHDILKAQSTIPEAKAVKYISQVAEALKQVHAQNRLHLDIKPGNIMIDTNDNAILIDFGTSKQYDEADGENTSTLMGKTPGYAPLEQLGNNIVKFMPATDIYALGATLYKMLSGNTPLSATLLASGEELDPLPANISEKTKSSILKAMSLNKKQRPQSIDEFLSLFSNSTIKNTHEQSCTKETKKFDPEETQLIFSEHQIHSSISNCGILNGHEWVDLGLPSGTKWATCNIGADKPSDYGEYYSWGETSTKSCYTKKDGKWRGLPFQSLQSLQRLGVIDTNGNLTSDYDAASIKWGDKWHIPTHNEFEELILKCQWIWSEQYGIKGYMITGPNGNSIFLPAAGFYEEELSGEQEDGEYWSSSCEENDNDAYVVCFNNSWHDIMEDERYYGKSIRPVIKDNKEHNGSKSTIKAIPKNSYQNTTSQNGIYHPSYRMITNEDIKLRFYELLVYNLSVEYEKIKDSSRFEDLGADSLDMVDIQMACEEEFGIKISEGLVEDITTVGQGIALIQSLIQRR